MTGRVGSLHLLEDTLAVVLRQGTRVATMLVASGLVSVWCAAAAWPGASDASMTIVSAGILLFILLPTLRVGFMLVAFLKGRDYRCAAAAACVLTIIGLGLAFATRLHA